MTCATGFASFPPVGAIGPPALRRRPTPPRRRMAPGGSFNQPTPTRGRHATRR